MIYLTYTHLFGGCAFRLLSDKSWVPWQVSLDLKVNAHISVCVRRAGGSGYGGKDWKGHINSQNDYFFWDRLLFEWPSRNRSNVKKSIRSTFFSLFRTYRKDYLIEDFYPISKCFWAGISMIWLRIILGDPMGNSHFKTILNQIIICNPTPSTKM